MQLERVRVAVLPEKLRFGVWNKLVAPFQMRREEIVQLLQPSELFIGLVRRSQARVEAHTLHASQRLVRVWLVNAELPVKLLVHG